MSKFKIKILDVGLFLLGWKFGFDLKFEL